MARLHLRVVSLIDSKGMQLSPEGITRRTSRARQRRVRDNCYAHRRTRIARQMRYEQTTGSTRHMMTVLNFRCLGVGVACADWRGAVEGWESQRQRSLDCSPKRLVATDRSRMLGARHPLRRSSGEAREGLWSSCLARPLADAGGRRMSFLCRRRSVHPALAAESPLLWAPGEEGECRRNRHRSRRPSRRHHN